MKFVIATEDYVGLGFAVRLVAEHHEVVLACNPQEADRRGARGEVYRRVGDGLVEKAALDDLLARRETLRDAYWIWDFNHSVEENELLRREGFKVFGGGRHANTMEHDRGSCLAFVEKHGLHAPPSFRFEQPAPAIAFLEANPDTAVHPPGAQGRGRDERRGLVPGR